MITQLYTDIEQTWYLDRLRTMYVKRPHCGTHLTVNHLLGTCQTCGHGRYARTAVKIQHIALDRMYALRMRDTTDVHQLIWLTQTLKMRVLTNLEYPLPEVKAYSYSRIAKFYEPATNTVIDFLKLDTNNMKVMRATDTLLTKHGYGYTVYQWEATTKSGAEVYRGAISAKETQAARKLIAALRQFGDLK